MPDTSDDLASSFVDLKVLNAVPPLPDNAIRSIFKQFDKLCDVIMFSLTSRRHWNIGRGFIYRLRQQIVTKFWNGERIICIGSSSISGNWPSTLKFSDKNRESFRRFVATPNQDGVQHIKPYDAIREWPNAIDNVPTPWNRSPLFESYTSLNAFENSVYDILTDFTPRNTIYVLRNLSKKQFVRDNGFNKLFAGHRIPKATREKRFTLGHVLLSHICWSSDPSTSIPNYLAPIHCGDWAGDMFDIVTLTEHQKEWDENMVQLNDILPEARGLLKDWEDVTDHSMRIIDDIYVANFGRLWRKHMTKVDPSSFH